MRIHRSSLQVVIIAFLFLAACGAENDTPALDAYADKTIVSGQGWGDLLLGKTTIQEVINKFGVKKVSLVASDYSGFELSYNKKQVAMLFIIEPGSPCFKDSEANILSAVPKIQAFLDSHPDCKALPLSSLSISTGSRKGNTFYKGATDKGVKLFAPSTDSYAHADGSIVPKDGRPSQMLAGAYPSDPEGIVYYESGIAFRYHGSKPLIGELSRSTHISAGVADPTEIMRISIFSPEQSN